MEIKRYKNFVRLTKILCLSVVAGLVVMLLIVPQIVPVQNKISFADQKSSTENFERIKVVEPSILGYDQANGPYEILADKIIQKYHEVSLEVIKARMIWKEQNTIEISAQNAVVGLLDKITKISGKVKIAQWHKSGKLYTEEIQLDQNNNIQSNQPFTITSIHGDVRGENGFLLLRNQNEAQLFGPLAMVINPRTQDKINISAQKSCIVSMATNKVLFTGNVIFTSKKLQITADNVESDYINNNKKAEFSLVKFNNGVKAVASNGRVATADRAEYIVKENKIILYDNVKLTEKDHVLSSNSIVYDTKLQTFVIEGGEQANDRKVEVIIKHE